MTATSRYGVPRKAGYYWYKRYLTGPWKVAYVYSDGVDTSNGFRKFNECADWIWSQRLEEPK